MRLYLLFILLATNLSISFAQNVGIGTNNPDASAKLEVKSNNSGFLPPRMTHAERNAIVNPATGLIVYCTDCDSSGQPQFYNGNRWCNMIGGIAATPIVALLPSVTIGTQIWNTKNLDVAKYHNGDPIPQVTDPTQWTNLTTGAWCWYNNDSTSYAATYGKLYNWYAVNDPRGLAPQGWRIPTEDDWNRLVKFIDPNADTTCSRSCSQSPTAGGPMKSTTGWSGTNAGATNSSGFSGLPGGYRYIVGLFFDVGGYGMWWSASEYGTTYAWYRFLRYNDANVSRHALDKTSGLSVRVVRDSVVNLQPNVPSITSNTMDSITTTSARSGGNISSDGGAPITARGIVWDTTTNPTIALSTKTNNGTGTGAYTSNITGLTPGRTYYVRAYATNSVGTAYGNQVSFTTIHSPVVDTSISSVSIGTQIWSTKNLDVARYRNGDPIPQVTNDTQWRSLTTGAWCWYNNDSATYAATYGRLYNWYAVNDPRGLAPHGWHIPSDSEWTILETFLGGTNDAGGKMKSTIGWYSPNTDATNSSGFSGFPGGLRYYTESFQNIGAYGLWWSSSAIDDGSAWNRFLYFYNSIIYKDQSNKTNGLSVRVIKD